MIERTDRVLASDVNGARLEPWEKRGKAIAERACHPWPAAAPWR